MRFSTEESALYGEFKARIDEAPDVAAVRAVQRQLQGDPRVYHAVAHQVNALARARIASFGSDAEPYPVATKIPATEAATTKRTKK